MLKKLTPPLALFASLAILASCAKEATSPRLQETGETVTATFQVVLPAQADTKTISDGLSATELLFMAYDQSGKHLDLDQSVTVSGRTATVSANLVKGIQYQFVFWAQKPNQYTAKLATDKKSLTITPADMMNADAWDAFYWHEPLAEVTGAFTKSITLKRPFAQINVGAPVTLSDANARIGGDFFAAAKSGLLIDATLTTGYKIKVPNQLNLLEGTVTGTEEVTMTKASYPGNAGEFLTVEGTRYDYAAMAYVLAGDTAATQDLELSIYTKQNGADVNLTRSIPNVPIRRNYRTNILGNVFTVEGKFNIVIDKEFAKVDNYAYDNYPTYTSIAALNAAFADGKGIGYKVAVVPENPVSGAQTITLPNTEDEVSIFLRGDFSGADITIQYSAVTDAKKPAKLMINAPLVAPATKSINKLIGNLPATTVVLAGTTTVDTADFYTASSTLHIEKAAKILNQLTVYAGSLLVEGFIETAIIDPSVAVNTADAVATVAEDGEVVRFVVQNLSAKIEAGAKVGTLVVSTTDGYDGEAPTVTVEDNATVETLEQKGEAVVTISGEAEVGEVEAENPAKINGEGAEEVDYTIKNEAQLTAAISAGKTNLKIGANFSVDKGYTLSSDLEINLSDYTITFTGETLANYPAQRAFLVTGEADLKIYNGAIKLTEHEGNTSATNLWGAIRFASTGNLMLENLKMDNYCQNGLNIKMLSGYASLSNVTIDSKYGGAIEVGGSDIDTSVYATADIEDCHFTNVSDYDWCSTTVATCYNGIAKIHSGIYKGYYGVYVFSSGGSIYIEDGCTITGSQAALVANKDQNSYSAYSDAKVFVSGGNINGAYLIDNSEHAFITLTGGTFSEDPSAYVAEDYSVMEKDGRYLVGIFPKTLIVSTAEQFNEVFSSTSTKSKNTQINIDADIDLSDVEAHTPIDISNSDKCSITVNGNGHTIKGMHKPLFDQCFVASIAVNNLTFEDCEITEASNGYVAVIAAYFDAGKYLNIENVTFDNCRLTGSNYGGVIYGAGGGYGNQSDGPVHMGALVKNCTFKNCEITSTGGGSVGTVTGHAAWNEWTKLTVEGCHVSNCVLSTSKANKAGAYFGTVGVAGGTQYGRKCGVYLKDCTWSDNSAKANDVESSYIFGRVASTGGELYIWDNGDYILAAHNYGSGDIIDCPGLVSVQ